MQLRWNHTNTKHWPKRKDKNGNASDSTEKKRCDAKCYKHSIKVKVISYQTAVEAKVSNSCKIIVVVAVFFFAVIHAYTKSNI